MATVSNHKMIAPILLLEQHFNLGPFGCRFGGFVVANLSAIYLLKSRKIESNCFKTERANYLNS